MQALAAPPFPPCDGCLLGEPPWRRSLADRGLALRPALTLDAVTARAGGRPLGSGGLGLVDLVANLNTEAAGWWDGGRFLVHVQGTAGRNPSAFIGDLQATDNIEADDAVRVYEAFYEHRGRTDRWRLRGGWQDYNSEFNVLTLATIHLNSSFGLQPEILQGQVPTFPLTSPGLVVHARPAGSFFLKAGVYEGVPANAIHPLSRVEAVAGDDGLVTAIEAGAARPGDGPGSYKVAAGAWHLDRDFWDPQGVERTSNRGSYLIAEHTFSGGREGRTWGLFGQLGFSRSDRNQVESYLGAGAVFSGWWPRRPDDSFAVGIARARLAGPFLASRPGRHRAEATWEATYRFALRPGLLLQPDLQYVNHPDAELGAEDVLVFSLRLVMSF